MQAGAGGRSSTAALVQLYKDTIGLARVGQAKTASYQRAFDDVAGGIIARTVGQLDHPAAGAGAAVLLDDYGTVVFTTHQLLARNEAVPSTAAGVVLRFPAAGVNEPLPVTAIIFDPTHDLAFGTIGADAVALHKLEPAQLAAHLLETRGTAVGYPLDLDRLHAAQGTLIGEVSPALYLDRQRVAQATLYDEASSTLYDEARQVRADCVEGLEAFPLPGMSGGGVFDPRGLLLGMTVAIVVHGNDVHSKFVPVGYIRAAYIAARPEQAAASGILLNPHDARLSRRQGCATPAGGLTRMALER